MQSEFSRLPRDSDADARHLWRVLPDGYRHRELADDSTDPGATVDASSVSALIDDAARSVDRIAALLSAP